MMERLTFEGNFCDIAMCDAEPDICGICDQRKVWERLKAYEDTGLLPEDFKKAFNEDALLKKTAQYLGTTPDRLHEWVKADKEDRLVALDEPVRPLVWGDDTHDRVLCPRCLCDLMGGFEFAPSCETQMFQCPHCGQPIDATKALPLEESEAEAALAGERKDGEG